MHFWMYRVHANIDWDSALRVLRTETRLTVYHSLAVSKRLGPTTIGEIDYRFLRFDDVLTIKLLGNYCFVIKEHIDASLGASNVPDSFDESRV